MSLAEGPLAALPEADPGIVKLYAERYTRVFGPRSLEGMRLGIYEHSSAARDLLQPHPAGLRAETISLGRSDDFVPIDTEACAPGRPCAGPPMGCTAPSRRDPHNRCDADRPLIADERGEWLRGDVVGILSALARSAHTVW